MCLRWQHIKTLYTHIYPLPEIHRIHIKTSEHRFDIFTTQQPYRNVPNARITPNKLVHFVRWIFFWIFKFKSNEHYNKQIMALNEPIAKYAEPKWMITYFHVSLFELQRPQKKKKKNCFQYLKSMTYDECQCNCASCTSEMAKEFHIHLKTLSDIHWVCGAHSAHTTIHIHISLRYFVRFRK